MTDFVPGGNILLARALRHHEIWTRPRHLRLWTYLLLEANASKKPRRIGGHEVGYGQVIKSFSKIAEENAFVDNNGERRWSKSEIHRLLRWLEAHGMIRTQRTELGTRITIVNFAKYQAFSSYRADRAAKPGTDLEPTRNHNNQSTQSDMNLTDRGRAIFDYWVRRRRAVTGARSSAPRTALRMRRIRERLADGYSEDDLRAAIGGCLATPFNVERGYTDIELILRDPAHVDRYRAAAPRRTPAQGSGFGHGAGRFYR